MMSGKYFLIPALFSVAGLMAAADSAHAQKGGGGRGGGGGGGMSRGGAPSMSRGGSPSMSHAGHSGSVNHGSSGHNHGHGSSVIIGLGFGYGLGYGYGLGGGYYGGGYYPYDYGYSYAPAYSEPRYVYYPPAQQAPVQPQIPPDAAAVRVYVPDPDAKVWFDGAATRQVGSDRLFHTNLTASATYRVRASWIQGGKEMIQERVVPVSPGQMSIVDFSRPVSEPLQPPPPVPNPKQD